jgi:protocatechuate 3,4-dioxygenase beta subunit
MRDIPSRRHFLGISACAVAGLPLADAPLANAWAQTPLPVTPECPEAPTLRQTEGPFYKPRSPTRADLREPGAAGRVIELTGFVLARDCKPLLNALVDLWHADDRGDYDERGFRYRGHVFTDATGLFRFLTVMPALYTGRTRHFHVKVQAPGRRLLTTQLYFPGEPANARDPIFRPELLMKTAEAGDGMKGRFDFVVG